MSLYSLNDEYALVQAQTACALTKPANAAGWRSAEVGLPPLSLQVGRSRVHSSCGGDSEGSGGEPHINPLLSEEGAQRVGCPYVSVYTKQLLLHKTAIVLLWENATLWHH